MSDAKTARPVAVVCGASRGLGYLLARELLRRGHHVVLCARSPDGVEIAAAELRVYGSEVVAVAADIGSGAEAGPGHRHGYAAVRPARCAGVQCRRHPGRSGGCDDGRGSCPGHGRDVLDLVHPALVALPELCKQRGILAITTLGGKVPAPHLLPYVAAKHAAVGFAEGLRVEAKAKGVSVTVGIPGLMRTGSP